MNVATHVTWSNCLADSTGSRRSTKVHATSIVAKNAIDQYKDHNGCGEKMVASVAKAPYAKSRRDGAFLGRCKFLRLRRRRQAAGSTANGRTARIKFCQSPALDGGWIFQNPVFRFSQRHTHRIRADAGACQNREDRIVEARGKVILLPDQRDGTAGMPVGGTTHWLTSSSIFPSARLSRLSLRCTRPLQTDIVKRMARPR